MASLFLAPFLAGHGTAWARGSTPSRPVHVAPSRGSAHLGPLPNIPQSLNNCGPAAIAEVLSYWDITRSQYQVQAVVRADESPRGMAPFGVPGYARTLGLRGLLGIGGSERLIKALISNGFPVIASQLVSLSFPVRHYRPIEAYDDHQALFISSDPYLGPGHTITYADFTRMWSVTDGRFIVLYPPSRQPLLDAVLKSAGWDRTSAYRHDLGWQESRLRSQRENGPGSPVWYYGYPSVAWDEMELRNYTAARQALRQATLHGANSIVVGWVDGEIQYRLHGGTE